MRDFLPVIVTAAVWSLPALSPGATDGGIRFNEEIRPILSNTCFRCHGPDEAERKAGLRLDTFEGATADHDGVRAVVPGDPDASELLYRVTASDPDDLMPPPGMGPALGAAEIAKLRQWISEGGGYQRHWSYEPPSRPAVPDVGGSPGATTVHNPIDAFVIARLNEEGLAPSPPESDRAVLARRVALDLTGLPPTPDEVRGFAGDASPDAYERFVDRLLARPAFGEHWARMWLDLARYADSSGYADDPPRTIWAYRDWVIRAFNENLPFDRFTIEQIAADLLEDADQDTESLVATAFHRNTQTNNEGGTDDEEFRNVAVVDRVNTTMQAWMGTTMNCAQCHTHKYDPITQEEYFRMFAILNNTADADRRDESPTIPVFTPDQRERRAALETGIAALKAALDAPPSPEEVSALARWEEMRAVHAPSWRPIRPERLEASSGAVLRLLEDGSLAVEGATPETDVYTLEGTMPIGGVTAIRLDALADPRLGDHHGPGRNGNFVLSEIAVTSALEGDAVSGRFVRLELPGEGRILHVAEVEVVGGGANLARGGTARQSTTGFGGAPGRAVDGNTDGNYQADSTTHTADDDPSPWWEVDLGDTRPIERIVVWNRTDNNLQSRLDGLTITVLDDARRPIWNARWEKAPERERGVDLGGGRPVAVRSASASFEQDNFPVASAIDGDTGAQSGWAVGPKAGEDHHAIFELAEPMAAGRFRIVLRHAYANHALGKFRLSVTDAPPPVGALPDAIDAILAVPAAERDGGQRAKLASWFRTIDPSLADERARLAALEKELATIAPATTVPVMRELPPGQHRTTHVQLRGSHLQKGDVVTPGLPEAFHPAPEAPNRLDLARWLVDPANPLTARVTANRFWEKLFGTGLVATSEEFGSQGEPPSHPELLDWLAVEFMESGWDMKHLLRLMVTSATYRQSSDVTPELLAVDPANRLLARGPRFRLSAEMIRDQALAVSGLLSSRMFGPPVRPPQPNLGVSAAFGGGIDWKTSEGEDRYRRGIYTTWRRSNPYPSMAAFDAPNREVCTVRRDRTNTPLQALVTLNDPVYIEAAQALARRMASFAQTPEERLTHGFRLCLSREPDPSELARLAELLASARERFAATPDQATAMATDPLGPVPEGADATELAALTVVGNVLMNLDEFLMRR